MVGGYRVVDTGQRILAIRAPKESIVHHNGLKTAALLGLLTSLILAVGYWFGGSSGLVIAVFLSLAMNGVTYFCSDKLALRSMGAQPVTEAQLPELYPMVRELATDGRPADAPALRQPDRAAQRVRHRA